MYGVPCSVCHTGYGGIFIYGVSQGRYTTPYRGPSTHLSNVYLSFTCLLMFVAKSGMEVLCFGHMDFVHNTH